MEWESINKEHTTERLYIYGGWLVRDLYYDYTMNSQGQLFITMVFVPDLDHLWTL